jgi:zinc protease
MLANGLRLVVVERRALPIVQVSVVVSGGLSSVPSADVFVARAVGALLSRGTARRSAKEFAEAIDDLGAVHSSSVWSDALEASIRASSKDLEPALELLAEELSRPAFSEDEIAQLRGRLEAEAAQRAGSVRWRAWNTLVRAFYPDHPYGASGMATKEELAAITRERLVAAHAGLVSADRTTIVVVGDVDIDRASGIAERHFGLLPKASFGTPVSVAPTLQPAATLDLVDFEGASQAHIMVAAPVESWGAPNLEVARLADGVLGASSFGSRLNRTLREEHGYTYWASSAIYTRRGGGLLVAEASVPVEKTALALADIEHELGRMCESRVPDDELKLARTRLLSRAADDGQTIEKLSELLRIAPTYGISDSLVLDRAAPLLATTADDVRRWSCARLSKERLFAVVAGDRRQLGPIVPAVGRKVRLRDRYGALESP